MASEVRIRAVERDYPVKRSTSPFDDWGAISEEAQSMTILRWLIEMQSAGFIYEGTLRKAQGRADGVHDLQVWSHLS